MLSSASPSHASHPKKPSEISNHIASLPATVFMKRLLRPDLPPQAGRYVSTPTPSSTEYLVLGDRDCSLDPETEKGRKPSSSKRTTTANGGHDYLKFSFTDVLKVKMFQDKVQKLEVHDEGGAATRLASYLFDIIKSYRYIRKQFDSSLEEASTKLEALHNALNKANQDGDGHKEVMDAINAFKNGGDPFNSLLDDLHKLGGQRKDASRMIDSLKAACQKDISSENFKMVTNGAVVLALAVIAGLSFVNPALLSLVPAVHGAREVGITMTDRVNKRAEKKKKQLEDVERSILELSEVEEKLKRVVSKYKSFRKFIDELDGYIELTNLEKAKELTTQTQIGLEHGNEVSIKLDMATDKAEGSVPRAPSSLSDTNPRRSCCIIM